MRASSIITTAMLLTCCSTPEERERNALMDRIEKQVQLPRGAMPLDDYARFYADVGKGQIAAIYVPPAAIAKEAAGECAQLTSNGDSKDVPCVAEDVQKVKAGERRWLSSQAEFPGVDAPGCQIVTISFDQKRGRFEDVSCLSDHAQY